MPQEESLPWLFTTPWTSCSPFPQKDACEVWRKQPRITLHWAALRSSTAVAVRAADRALQGALAALLTTGEQQRLGDIVSINRLSISSHGVSLGCWGTVPSAAV